MTSKNDSKNNCKTINSHKNENLQMGERRSFIKKGLLATAVAPFVSLSDLATTFAAGKDLPMVSGKEPLAKALKYVEKSTIKGKYCDNCYVYKAIGDTKTGTCTFFAGKRVPAKAYCNSWQPVKK